MRAARFVAVLILSALLTGCWGSQETDELAYVLAVGFDKGPENNVITTFQIANPIAVGGTATSGGGGGGGGRQAKPLINVTTIQRLPIGAFSLVGTQRSREISLLHATAYVYSEELAKEGLSDYLFPLNRFRETRGTALVLICKGRARDFLEKNIPVLEADPAKQYHHLIMLNRRHGLSVISTYSEFYSKTKSDSVQATVGMAAISKEDVDWKAPAPDTLGDYTAGDLPSNKGEAQFLGVAVFDGDRMVGEITGDEARYLNMLTGDLFQSYLTITDPIKKDESIGLSLLQASAPKVKVTFSAEGPVIDVDLYQEPNIVGISSGINYESVELKPVLERALEDLLRERCRQLVTRSQEEFRADIFGFGKVAKKNFLTLDQWEQYDWIKMYPQARVNINVHVKIRRTGLMFKTQPVRH